MKYFIVALLLAACGSKPKLASGWNSISYDSSARWDSPFAGLVVHLADSPVVHEIIDRDMDTSANQNHMKGWLADTSGSENSAIGGGGDFMKHGSYNTGFDSNVVFLRRQVKKRKKRLKKWQECFNFDSNYDTAHFDTIHIYTGGEAIDSSLIGLAMQQNIHSGAAHNLELIVDPSVQIWNFTDQHYADSLGLAEITVDDSGRVVAKKLHGKWIIIDGPAALDVMVEILKRIQTDYKLLK